MNNVPTVRQPGVPGKPADRWPNSMVFPQNLRDAIPDMPTCTGRVLVLDSFDLHSIHTDVTGPRVSAVLVVKETGKLTGTFEILLDLKAEAARLLAQKLNELADEAEKKTPEPFYNGPIEYRRR